MFCPVCGAQVQDGMATCPVCNASMGGAPVQPEMVQPAMEQPVMQQPMMQQSQYQQPVAEVPKKKTGLIVSIIAAIVAVIALVVVLLVFVVFKDKSKGIDGTYTCDAYQMYGIDVELVIDGDDFTMTMNGWGQNETTAGSISVDGDYVTLTSSDGEIIEGTYEDGVINLEGMEFEKK